MLDAIKLLPVSIPEGLLFEECHDVTGSPGIVIGGQLSSGGGVG